MLILLECIVEEERIRRKKRLKLVDDFKEEDIKYLRKIPGTEAVADEQ